MPSGSSASTTGGINRGNYDGRRSKPSQSRHHSSNTSSNCCCRCLKGIICLVVSIIFLQLGIALIVVGIIASIKAASILPAIMASTLGNIVSPPTASSSMTTTHSPDLPPEFQAVVDKFSYGCIGIGCFLILLACLSFISFRSQCATKIVTVFYFVISIACCALCFTLVIAFFSKDQPPAGIDPIRAAILPLVAAYKPITPKLNDISLEGLLLDAIQANLHCCGANGQTDYAQSGKFPKTFNMLLWLKEPTSPQADMSILVAPTCCKTQDEVSINATSAPFENLPNATNIEAPRCWDKGGASLRHHDGCVKAIYQLAMPHRGWIVLAGLVGTVLFLAVAIGLGINYCKKDDPSISRAREQAPIALVTPVANRRLKPSHQAAHSRQPAYNPSIVATIPSPNAGRGGPHPVTMMSPPPPYNPFVH